MVKPIVDIIADFRKDLIKYEKQLTKLNKNNPNYESQKDLLNRKIVAVKADIIDWITQFPEE